MKKLAFLAPALSAVVVSSATLSNELVFDDAESLRRAAAPSGTQLWDLLRYGRGLTYLVHRLDLWMWGSWTPGFHLTNAILYVVATILVTTTAQSITRSNRLSLVCGILFAVHPVHIEVVASIAFRKDIIAMIFSSLTMVLWLSSRRSLWCYPLCLIAFALGMLAKEVAVVGLVGVLITADFVDRIARPDLGPTFPMCALRAAPLLVCGALATIYFGGDLIGRFSSASIHAVTDGRMSTYSEVLASSLCAVPSALRLLVFPFSLSADYPVHSGQGLGDLCALTGMVIALGWASCIVVCTSRRWRVCAIALSWLGITYLPISNVLPVNKFFLADRYLFVPSFGACLLIAVLLDQLRPRERSGIRGQKTYLIVTSILILLFGIRSVVRCADWRNERALWSSAAEVSETSPRAHFNLGVLLNMEGEKAAALACIRRAVKLQPGFGRAQRLHAQLLWETGRAAEAVQRYRVVLQLYPNESVLHSNFGRVLYEVGEVDEALAEYDRALLLDSKSSVALVGKGAILLQRGDIEGAKSHLSRAVEHDRDSVTAHHNLGLCLHKEKQCEAAVLRFKHAIHLDPLHIQARLGAASCLDEIGRDREALAEYKRALRLLDERVVLKPHLQKRKLQIHTRIEELELQRRQTGR